MTDALPPGWIVSVSSSTPLPSISIACGSWLPLGLSSVTVTLPALVGQLGSGERQAAALVRGLDERGAAPALPPLGASVV